VRRILPILFHTPVALSFLLFVFVSVLWIRSYHLSDQFSWRSSSGSKAVNSAQGFLTLHLTQAGWPLQPADSLGFQYQRDLSSRPVNYLTCLSADATDIDTNWEKAGFAWYSKRATRGAYSAIGVAPFWSLATFTALLPLAWATRQIRSRLRNSIGLCPTCNYDLRASPTRCPECGAETNTATPSPVSGRGRG